MESCPECGSLNLIAVVRDGDAVRECGLCGEVLDDDPGSARVRQVRQARELGVDPAVFALLSVFESFPGTKVLASHGGDLAARSLPFVQWICPGLAGYQLLENLTKSLQMTARNHRLHWVIEVEFQNRLCFELKPRVPPQQVGAEAVRLAQLDLEVLARDLAAHRTLSWWHRPTAT